MKAQARENIQFIADHITSDEFRSLFLQLQEVRVTHLNHTQNKASLQLEFGTGGLMSLQRWFYKGGHPNTVAKVLNKAGAILHALGISPNHMVTIEVVGRKSGKSISFPLAMTVINRERYLVSMLGENANWVRNIKAAGGKATLRHGIREEVILEEVDVQQRAVIIKEFLQIAPGARAHIPVDKDAPITAFEEIAAKVPVFKLCAGKS